MPGSNEIEQFFVRAGILDLLSEYHKMDLTQIADIYVVSIEQDENECWDVIVEPRHEKNRQNLPDSR